MNPSVMSVYWREVMALV